MDKSPLIFLHTHFSLAWAHLRAEGYFVLCHLWTPKAFPVHDSIRAVSKEPPHFSCLRDLVWHFPGCATRGQLCPGLLGLSGLGLWGWPLGCVHLMVGNNPRKRVVLLTTRTILSPQAFHGTAKPQASTPSEAWLWLCGNNYFMENQSNFIYISNKSFKSRVLSWRQLEGEKFPLRT